MYVCKKQVLHEKNTKKNLPVKIIQKYKIAPKIQKPSLQRAIRVCYSDKKQHCNTFYLIQMLYC